jgi:hypothetical protein
MKLMPATALKIKKLSDSTKEIYYVLHGLEHVENQPFFFSRSAAALSQIISEA